VVSSRTIERAAAIDAARAAGASFARRGESDGLTVERKGEIDLVTNYDRIADRVIAEALGRAFPEYGILSEEGLSPTVQADPYWIVDPLDGTTNFIKGYPLTSVSIALAQGEEIILGVVLNPAMDELFVAEKGQGATLNGRQIGVSATEDLNQALLASGFPYDVRTTKKDNLRSWQSLLKRSLSLRCDGCASLDLCHVACGRLDGFWERGLSIWDVAAGAIIATEAGARVTDLRGTQAELLRGEILAANPILWQEILTVIQEAEAQS
jgi:myo-inositol-1(or 4)-monophosphatase